MEDSTFPKLIQILSALSKGLKCHVLLCLAIPLGKVTRTAVTFLTVDGRESCSWRGAESPSGATELSDSLDERVPPTKSGAILHKVA